jgi:DNA-binding NarL/FixJ family response regulator
MIDIIRLVHAGQRRIPREIALLIAKHATDDILTEREFDVLRGIAKGSSNKIIAADLAISERTVKNHLKASSRSSGPSDRIHAVMIALK